jgi:hypothetical protein
MVPKRCAIRPDSWLVSQRRHTSARPSSGCGTSASSRACPGSGRVRLGTFRPHETGGYWVSNAAVDATDQVIIEDLIGCHAQAGIELRITPSIWPFWRRVVASTVEYSGCRLRNAAPHPDQLG